MIYGLREGDIVVGGPFWLHTNTTRRELFSEVMVLSSINSSQSTHHLDRCFGTKNTDQQ